MDGFGTVELRDVCLSIPREVRQLDAFLEKCGIKRDPLTYAAGLFDGEEMICSGGFDGNTIKCVAVDPLRRGEALANRIVSHLVGLLRSRGEDNVKVFTKPENEDLFSDMGFRKIGSADLAILMENGRPGIAGWLEKLAASKTGGKSGAIVMNANPFTLGHRYLIEKALSMCDTLHLFVVRTDRSVFPFPVRLRLIREGIAGLPHIVLHDGGDYVISSSTFPSYFLKEYTSAVRVHAALDSDIFARHIAPCLGIGVRFVGSEPEDRVTAEYNAVMAEVFPQNGLEPPLVIDRLEKDGLPVSASRVRRLFAEGKIEEIAPLVPETTLAFLASEEAAPIAAAIRASAK